MARKRYTTEQIIGLLRRWMFVSDRVRRLARSVEASASRSKAIIAGGASTAVSKLDQAKRLKVSRSRELERLKRAVSELSTPQIDPEGSSRGKILSPSRKRACVEHVRSQLDVSERRACSVVGQPRATHRRHLKTPDDEAALTAAIGAAGNPVRPLRLQAHPRDAGCRRLAGQRQTRLSYLAAGRAESTKQTIQTGPSVAQ